MNDLKMVLHHISGMSEGDIDDILAIIKRHVENAESEKSKWAAAYAGIKTMLSKSNVSVVGIKSIPDINKEPFFSSEDREEINTAIDNLLDTVTGKLVKVYWEDKSNR